MLYFEDHSARHNLGEVADGLTEGLIGALGAVQGLSVVSAGGVAPFRGSEVARDSVARALGVGTLVQGSVEAEQGGIRVTVRVLDDAGIELARTAFNRPSRDLVGLSDSLAQEAALLIRRRIGEEVEVSQSRLATRNSDAWLRYRRARGRRARGDSLYRAGDRAGFAREYLAADSNAAAAETLDPRWTAPVVLRGTLEYWRARRATDDPGLANQAIDGGLAHARHALALDPRSADALELRGALAYWRWLYPLEADSLERAALLAGARADLERATQLQPAQAGAYAMLSHLYANAPDKSLVDVVLAATKAMEADAYLSNSGVVLNRLAHAMYDLGQFADADRWCREGRRRFPADYRFVECDLLLMTSKYVPVDSVATPARAWQLADSVVDLTPDERDRRYERLYGRVLVAGVLARAGLVDSARRVLRATKADPEVDPSRDLANTAAFIWTLAGDTAEALNQIKAYLVANPGAGAISARARTGGSGRCRVIRGTRSWWAGRTRFARRTAPK